MSKFKDWLHQTWQSYGHQARMDKMVKGHFKNRPRELEDRLNRAKWGKNYQAWIDYFGLQNTKDNWEQWNDTIRED